MRVGTCFSLLLGWLALACGSSDRSEPASSGGAPAGGGAGTGGSGSGGKAGGSGASGAAGKVAGTTGASIAADIDGVTVLADLEARSLWFQGLADFSIALTASTKTQRWFILTDNAVGTTTCLSGGYYIELTAEDPAPGGATHKDPGTCNVTLSAAAPEMGDVVEGTFSATLVDGDAVHEVTNGSFHLPRIDSPL